MPSMQADFLDQIATYLQQQGIGNADPNNGVVDIRVGKIPGDPDACVVIIGEPGIRQPNVDVQELTFPRFQVLVATLIMSPAAPSSGMSGLRCITRSP